MEGKKKVLLPLVEMFDESHYTTVKVCLVDGNKFSKEIKNIMFDIL